MRRTFVLVAASCLGMVLPVEPVFGDDVVVRAPFVSVTVVKGRGVKVAAPGTRVSVPLRQKTMLQPREEILPAPAPMDASAALTHAEFARIFKPAPGNYEVMLIHPYSRCPVQVCFTLPDGCPKKVRVERGELEFDYGEVEVELRFKRDGRVKVEYRD